MKVTRQSQLTGMLNTQDLPITPEQVTKFIAQNRAWAKQCFPNLSSEQLEFFITGITGDEVEQAGKLGLEEIFDDNTEDTAEEIIFGNSEVEENAFLHEQGLI